MLLFVFYESPLELKKGRSSRNLGLAGTFATASNETKRRLEMLLGVARERVLEHLVA